MDASAALWIGTAVAVLVFLDLLFVEVRRAVREGKRFASRLEAYAELPLFAKLDASERDAERIARAIDALPPLLERAQAALTVLGRYRPKGSSPG